MSSQPPSQNSNKALLGQALTFLGPLVAVGGALALLRTREPSLFFTALMPLGLILTLMGLWIRSQDHDT